MIKRKLIEIGRHKRHLTDAIEILASSLLSKVLALLVLMYVSRTIGGVDFGKYQTLLFTLALFSSAIQGSLNLYTTKFVAEKRGTVGAEISQVIFNSYAWAIFLGFLSCLATYLLSERLAVDWLGDGALQPLLEIASLTLLFNPLAGVQAGILSGLSRFRYSALMSLLSPVLSAPAFLVLSVQFGVVGAVWGMVIQAAVSSGFGEAFVRKAGLKVRCNEGLPVLLYGFKDIAKYCFPTFLSGFVIAPANWYVTVLLVNAPDGYLEMASYGVANQWKQAILFIPTALSSFVMSHLSQSISNSTRYQRIFMLSVLAALVSGLVVALLIAVFSTQIVSAYAVGAKDAWLVLSVSSISAAVVAVNNMYSRAAASLGRTWSFLSYEVIWAAVFVGTALVLIPAYRGLGVAAAAFVAAVIQLFFQAFVIRVRHSD